ILRNVVIERRSLDFRAASRPLMMRDLIRYMPAYDFRTDKYCGKESEKYYCTHSVITSIARTFACHSSCERSISRTIPSISACLSDILPAIISRVCGLRAFARLTAISANSRIASAYLSSSARIFRVYRRSEERRVGKESKEREAREQ